MKWAATLSALLLGGLIFFSLFMGSVDRNTHRYGQALEALDALELADTSIDNDVLKARIGLLRDYDSLVAGDVRARATLQHLRSLSSEDAPLLKAVDALASSYEAKSLQLEVFKSQNSLLSNSLAYFWSESNAQLQRAGDTGAVRDASLLTSAVHRLSLDTSSDAVVQARKQLEEAARHDARTPLLPHGRMLLALLPQTDATIRRMRPISSLESYLHTKRYLRQRQAILHATARQVRIVLFGLSIVMLTALLYLGKALRERARVLRRRSEFDRLMVAISRSLVASDRRGVDERIERGLERLADWVQLPSARLCLLPAGGAPRLWPDPQDEAFRTTVSAAATSELGAPHELLVVDADDSIHALCAPERACRAQWVCVRKRVETSTQALLFFRLPVLLGRRDSQMKTLVDYLPQLHVALDTLFDALERQRLEGEAQALEHRLELARRMETIGTMASGISHNFNNIVGAIRGNAEIAIAKLDSQSPALEHLIEISNTTAHAYELIESILSFGRVQNYRMQPIELNALLQGAVSLLSVSLPSTVAIDLRQERAPLHTLGNPAQLQQVILNLATNAAQAMDMRGTIAIHLSTAIDETDDGTARRIARLHVSDHGMGIAPDQLERIFDLFFTTRTGGTGLGLATVRKIVDNHNGRIDVQSVQGDGTTFLVDLPLYDVEHVASHGTVLEVSQPRHASWLLLCDTPDELERLEEMLAALGHEPVGVLEADAAVNAVAGNLLRFDGVLIKRDRVGDAQATIVALQVAAPDLPIVLATRAVTLSAREALANAIVEIIAPPFEMEVLAITLERALARADGRRSAG
mgnify:CR=1 FL=1